MIIRAVYVKKNVLNFITNSVRIWYGGRCDWTEGHFPGVLADSPRTSGAGRSRTRGGQSYHCELAVSLCLVMRGLQVAGLASIDNGGTGGNNEPPQGWWSRS